MYANEERYLQAKSHSASVIGHGAIARVIQRNSSLSAVPGNITNFIGLAAIERIQARVNDHVRRNMTLADLNLERIRAADSNFLCPSIYASAADVERFDRVMRNPLFMTSADIEAALNLLDDEHYGQDMEPGHQIYYLRLWTVPIPDCRAILARVGRDLEIVPRQVTHWITRMDDIQRLNPEQEHINMLYVGTCMTPKTPLERYKDDIAHREYGFLSNFLQAMAELAPTVYQSAQIFAFPNALLGTFASRVQRDDREMVIIHFFGQLNLLNQYVRGYFPSYRPSDEDYSTFMRLDTDFLATLLLSNPMVAHAEEDAVAGINDWVDRIAEFAAENPGITGSLQHPFNAMQKEAVKAQAVGYSYGGQGAYTFGALSQMLGAPKQGHRILALIGKDVPLNEYIAGYTMLGARPGEDIARAGYLLRDFLARLLHWEGSKQTLPGAWHYSQFEPFALSFANLFPFLRFEDPKVVDFCLESLRSWMAMTKPFVTITFGRQVTAAAFSNFCHLRGISTRRFIDHIGDARIISYAPLDWVFDETVSGPPAQLNVIAVPCIDPGYIKHLPDAAATAACRVIDYALMQACLLSDAVRQIIDRTMGLVPNRDMVLNEAIARCGRGSADPKVVRFYNGLFAAVGELNVALRNVNNPAMRDRSYLNDPSFREARVRVSVQRTKDAGYAVGERRSAERRRQLLIIWKMKNPDVLMHMRAGNVDDFLVWGMALQTGTSLRMASMQAALGQGADVAELQHVLQTCAPDDAQDNSWMFDPIQREQALARKAHQLREGLPADFFSPENQRRRVLSRYGDPDDPINAYTETLEGREVKIYQNAKMPLLWRDGNINRRMVIPVHRDAIGVEDDDVKRFVHFLADGIGIRNSRGDTLNRPGYSETEGVLRVSDFVATKHGDNLTRLWMREREAIVTNLPIGMQAPEIPEGIVAGRPPLPQAGGGLRGVERPIEEGDAAWLILNFLREQFPRGGYFHTGTVELFGVVVKPHNGVQVSISSVWPGWTAFLARNPAHPYSQTLANWATNGSAGAGQLVSNIRALTEIQWDARHQRRIGGRAHGCRCYRIAPAPAE